MIGASDLDGYASTVVTLALLFVKRVDVIVVYGLANLAELLRLNSSGSVVSAGVGVRNSEIVIGSGCTDVCWWKTVKYFSRNGATCDPFR